MHYTFYLFIFIIIIFLFFGGGGKLLSHEINTRLS